MHTMSKNSIKLIVASLCGAAAMTFTLTNLPSSNHNVELSTQASDPAPLPVEEITTTSTTAPAPAVAIPAQEAPTSKKPVEDRVTNVEDRVTKLENPTTTTTAIPLNRCGLKQGDMTELQWTWEFTTEGFEGWTDYSKTPAEKHDGWGIVFKGLNTTANMALLPTQFRVHYTISNGEQVNRDTPNFNGAQVDGDRVTRTVSVPSINTPCPGEESVSRVPIGIEEPVQGSLVIE